MMVFLDLLSTVVAVLGEQNMLSAEIEVDYMWGLIHPSFLVGDARYQLTTFSSAVNQLKSIRRLAESRSTLHRGTIVSVRQQQTCIKYRREQLGYLIRR